MKNLGYYNGEVGLLEDIKVPMNDRVCWFGDGVYDAGPAKNGIIFAIDQHIDRFFNSARLVDIQIPCTKDELRDLLNDLVKKVDGDQHFVYYQCTRGTAVRKHDYEPGPGNLWVMIKQAKMPDGLTPIQLRTEQDRRYFFCNIKTLNLLPAVLSSQEAKKEGVFETIYWRDMDGMKRVTECAHSNVHIMKNGELWTAPCDELILPGIARRHLIEACGRIGIPVNEKPYSLEDVFAADEVIVTSSSNLCLYANTIDGIAVGGKAPELARALRDEVFAEFDAATAID